MITKYETRTLKGISVLGMVLVHLFDRMDYIQLYTPLIFLDGKPLVYSFGQLGDFAVLGFAMLSGYGHYQADTKENKKLPYRLKKLLNLYVNYWIVLMLFVILSIVLGKGGVIPRSASDFLQNFCTISSSYNGTWWYLSTYALLVMTSSMWIKIGRISSDRSIVSMLILLILMYITSIYIRFYIPNVNYVLYKFGLYIYALSAYGLGILSAKTDFIARCRSKIKNNGAISRNTIKLISLCAFVVALLLRGYILQSVVFSLFSGIVVFLIVLLNELPACLRGFFGFLGSNATNIWLVHFFFIGPLFGGFVFLAKYPY